MMKRRWMVLVVMFLSLIWYVPVECEAAKKQFPYLPTDVTEATEGNTLVGCRGSFEENAERVIKDMNEARLEACKKGYPDPRNPERCLTQADYVPLQWSSDLQQIARIRVAECGLEFSHERPNGKGYSDIITAAGISSYNEIIASEVSSAESAVRAWCEKEKELWLDGVTSVWSTGHYQSIINPDNIYVGVASFSTKDFISHGAVGEFLSQEWIDFCEERVGHEIVVNTTPLSNYDYCIQTIEVSSEKLSKPEVEADEYGINEELGVWMGQVDTVRKYLVQYYEIEQGSLRVTCMDDLKWKCKSKGIKVTEDGTMYAKKYGTYKLKIKYTGDSQGSFVTKIKVRPLGTFIRKIKTTKNTLYVKFRKVKKIDGYEVKLKDGRRVIKKVNLKKNKTSIKFKNLSKNWYSVEIRPYKKVKGKKVYSADYLYMNIANCTVLVGRNLTIDREKNTYEGDLE